MLSAIWLTAIAAYLAFLAWYHNWRGPLAADEVARYLAIAARSPAWDARQLEVIRDFLERDDGREFLMLNLIRVAPGPVADPDSGEPKEAMEMLGAYTGPFMRALLRRAGHPALLARKVGGYMDAWNVEPDPGWTVSGFVRYRSRRDLVELATAPEFAAIHRHKQVALPTTLSFPSRAMPGLMIGPKIWVALLLALVTALASCAVLLFS